VATQGSALWNFVLNEQWVFDDRRQRRTMLYRLAGFLAMNNILLLLHLPLLWWLVTSARIYFIWANLGVLVLMTGVRFVIADQILWKRLKDQPLTRTRKT
jgi:putative flippase GtrA